FDNVAARYEWPIKIQARYVRVQHENMQTTLQFAQFQAFSTTKTPTPIQDGWFGFDNREHGDSLTHIDGQWLTPSSKPELRLIFGSFDKKPSLSLKNKSTQQMHLQIRVASNMESTIHHPYSANLGAIDTTQSSPHFDREITGNLFTLSNTTTSALSTVDLHQALISGTHRNVQVVASGATECVRLHRADFQRVLAKFGIPISSLLEAYMHDVSSNLPLLTTLPQEKSPFRQHDALQVFRLEDTESTSSIVIDVIETSSNNVVGSGILTPSQLHKTNGALSTPLFTSTTNVVGEILLRYVKIKPFQHELNNLQSAQRTQWFHGSPSDMGHRGLGRSYYQALGYRMAHIRENTMSSFVVAGYHGADWIEFDVQLSQDRVPVIYHDFFFKAALEDRRGRSGGFTKTGLHDLTLAQLNTVEWRHGKHVTDIPRFKQLVLKHWCKIIKKPKKKSTTKTPARQTKDYSWMKLSEQFPTLENLLKTVPPYVGLNIEIKYPVDPPHAPLLRELASFEMNAYLDDILKVIFEHSNGRRNIVFSCFDPDVCVMLRVKQTQYPVFFLTFGVDLSGRVPDVRTLSLETAVPFSRMEQLQGIVTNSLPLFNKPELIRAIRNDQLKLWTWGDYNTGHGKVQFQKKYGVHGVISDNVGDLTKQDGKIRPRDPLSTVS
ncbi:glycerophosphodiesterase, partial [Thraustotheca clavata]